MAGVGIWVHALTEHDGSTSTVSTSSASRCKARDQHWLTAEPVPAGHGSDGTSATLTIPVDPGLAEATPVALITLASLIGQESTCWASSLPFTSSPLTAGGLFCRLLPRHRPWKQLWQLFQCQTWRIRGAWGDRRWLPATAQESDGQSRRNWSAEQAKARSPPRKRRQGRDPSAGCSMGYTGNAYCDAGAQTRINVPAITADMAVASASMPMPLPDEYGIPARAGGRVYSAANDRRRGTPGRRQATGSPHLMHE